MTNYWVDIRTATRRESRESVNDLPVLAQEQAEAAYNNGETLLGVSHAREGLVYLHEAKRGKDLHYGSVRCLSNGRGFNTLALPDLMYLAAGVHVRRVKIDIQKLLCRAQLEVLFPGSEEADLPLHVGHNGHAYVGVPDLTYRVRILDRFNCARAYVGAVVVEIAAPAQGKPTGETGALLAKAEAKAGLVANVGKHWAQEPNYGWVRPSTPGFRTAARALSALRECAELLGLTPPRSLTLPEAWLTRDVPEAVRALVEKLNPKPVFPCPECHNTDTHELSPGKRYCIDCAAGIPALDIGAGDSVRRIADIEPVLKVSCEGDWTDEGHTP